MPTQDYGMNPIQKSNLPIAITSIAGGACLAASITNLITDKPDYPIIAQAIIFTGWLVLWTPILFILFEKWVMPRLTGISRRDFVVHIALSFVISALIVFTTPISHQLYLPRKVLLEINATARKNPLATGAEIGILTASMDGSIIPWSEFSWGKNWDRIDDRPYFHDINPAQLVWQGYTREGSLSLSLISSSSTGILEVKMNGVKHTFDSYEESNGTIKQVDFPVFQKDWHWVVFSLTCTLAIGVLIFIGTVIPRSFLAIPLVTGAIILNLTVFQKYTPLPALRSLSTNKIDEVAVTDQLWAINDRFVGSILAAYLYPTLRDTTLISTPELITELTNPALLTDPNLKFTTDMAFDLLARLLALKEYNYLQYDYLLTSNELATLEQEPLSAWDLSTGGKFVVLSGSEKKIYVMMKYNRRPLYYYFVPIEIAKKLNRNFK